MPTWESSRRRPFAIRSLFDDDRLVEVLADWRTGITPLSAVYAPNRLMRAKVRVFIGRLVALLESHPDRPLR